MVETNFMRHLLRLAQCGVPSLKINSPRSSKMKTKNWLILLASCVALAAAPMMGCGDDNDPSSNNGSNNNTADVISDEDADEGDSDVEEGDSDVKEGDSDVEEGDSDVEEGDPDTGDTNNTPSNCVPNDFFTGQAYAAGSDAHNGGNPVDAASVTLVSSGLQNIFDAVKGGEANEQGFITPAAPITVTGALVIGTGRTDKADTVDVIEGNDWLFVQDADTTIVINAGPGGNPYEDGAPTVAIKVGDKVSFVATQLQNYSGNAQVSSLTGFTIDSSDNDVPFTDLTGQNVTMEDWGKLVRVSGELIGVDSGDCGPDSYTCFTLAHGDKTTILRTNSNFTNEGDCVTFFGPVGAHPGPAANVSDNKVQLDETNYAWTWTD